MAVAFPELTKCITIILKFEALAIYSLGLLEQTCKGAGGRMERGRVEDEGRVNEEPVRVRRGAVSAAVS